MKWLIAAFVFFNCAFANAQSVSIKKNNVLIDGKECLKMRVTDPNNISFLDLNGNELVTIQFASDSYKTRFNTILFFGERSLRTYSLFSKKSLIRKLVEDGVIENCAVNPDKVTAFILKYNENIRTF